MRCGVCRGGNTSRRLHCAHRHPTSPHLPSTFSRSTASLTRVPPTARVRSASSSNSPSTTPTATSGRATSGPSRCSSCWTRTCCPPPTLRAGAESNGLAPRASHAHAIPMCTSRQAAGRERMLYHVSCIMYAVSEASDAERGPERRNPVSRYALHGVI